MIYIGTREYKYGRMIMSHMVSDDITELHAFTKHIGISEKHFQNKNNKPHYDISKSYKSKALKMFGVKEVDDREIINILKKLNENITMTNKNEYTTEYTTEFSNALNAFQKKYRASTSGDLQTFVLGLKDGVEIFKNKPKKKIELSLEEFIKLGGDISKIDYIDIRAPYANFQNKVSKVEYSHKNDSTDFYKIYFVDDTIKEVAHFWIYVNAEFSLN